MKKVNLFNSILLFVNIIFLAVNIAEYISLNKVKYIQPKTPVQSQVVEMQSQVIVREPDFSNPPSYTNPANWKILRMGDKYFVQLPAGTVDADNVFSSAEEAQEEINDRAKRSYKRWKDSGGIDF